MGTRHYFYILDNEMVRQLNRMTKETFFQWAKEKGIGDSSYVPLYEVGETYYEFGKYYENAHTIQQMGAPLFSDPELKVEYEEYEPVVVGKEAMLDAILHTQKQIVSMYDRLLGDTPEPEYDYEYGKTNEERYRDHLVSMQHEWKNRFTKTTAIHLNEDSPVITTSWKYEYAIFEMVRLYKTTDWDHHQLLFMGW